MLGFIDRRALRVIVWTIVGAMVLAAAIEFIHLKKKTIITAVTPLSMNGPSRVPRVMVEKVKSGPIARVLDIPGSLRPFYESNLYAKASGYISSVLVDIGDHVKAGQLLAVIAEPELKREYAEKQASLAAAQAAVQQAASQLDQYQRSLGIAQGNLTSAQAALTLQQAIYASSKQLFKGDAISQQAFEQATSQLTVAQAGVDVARAKIAAAEAQIQSGQSALTLSRANVMVARAKMEKIQALLAYDQIIAPFDGVITVRGIDPGDFVQSAARAKSLKPLFQIVSQTKIRVFVDVPEQDVRFVHVGTPAEVTPFGYDDVHLKGTITRTADALDVATRTLRCEIDLDNPQNELRGGMYAEVKLYEQRAAGILVPVSALIARGGHYFVMLVRHDHAVEVRVKTGLSTSLMVQIISGLRAGDELITRGQDYVRDGARVVPIAKLIGAVVIRRNHAGHRLAADEARSELLKTKAEMAES